MSRRLDGSDRGYLISGEAVARLAKGIHAADNARRSIKAPKLRTAYDDGSTVRIGKCSADWDKGTCANVDLWEDETACVPGETSPADTIEDVVNLLFDIAADSWVIIAEGATGQWFVVAAEPQGPRLGTINATWTKGQTATVTRTNANGTAISPAETFIATNHFATVTVESGTKKVLCVLVDDLWLLVAAEC